MAHIMIHHASHSSTQCLAGMHGDGELWVDLTVFNQPKNNSQTFKLGYFHKGPKIFKTHLVDVLSFCGTKMNFVYFFWTRR